MTTTPLGSSLPPLLKVLSKAIAAQAPGELDRSVEPGPPGAVTRTVMRALRRSAPKVPVRDEWMERADGTRLRLRIHDPEVSGIRPVIVHAHGGGFRIGRPDDSDAHLAQFAHHVGAVVVSVAYRLIPKFPYPAAVDDVLAALAWVSAEATRLRIDPGRLAMTGESAGGNLVLAAALAPSAPKVRLLLLEEPWLDISATPPSPEPVRAMYDKFTEELAWCRAAYSGEVPVTDPRVSPGLSDQLGTLPATVILVGDLDLLVNQQVAFVERARAQGAQVSINVFPGIIHGTHGLTIMKAARDWETVAISCLRSELNAGSPAKSQTGV